MRRSAARHISTCLRRRARLRPRSVLRAPLLVLRFLDRGAATSCRSTSTSSARRRASWRSRAIRRGDAPWTVDTLYFGGGTPSRLGGDGVARAVDARARALRARAGRRGHASRRTPRTSPPSRVARGARAGVNRLSLGAQSFDDACSRGCTARTTRAAIERAVDARASGRHRQLSLDLIFALPEALERDLGARRRARARARADAPLAVRAHRSSRTRRSGAGVRAASRRVAGRALRGGVPPRARRAHRAPGFEHYEVSNFGRPGRRSRHNSSYWTRRAVRRARSVRARVRRTRSGAGTSRAYADWLRPSVRDEDPTRSTARKRSPTRTESPSGVSRTADDDGLAVDRRRDRTLVRPWVDAGWATCDRRRPARAAPPLGWLRLDALAADLTLVRSRY